MRLTLAVSRSFKRNGSARASASRMISSLPKPRSPRNKAGHRSRGKRSMSAHRLGALCLDACSSPGLTSTSRIRRVEAIEYV